MSGKDDLSAVEVSRADQALFDRLQAFASERGITADEAVVVLVREAAAAHEAAVDSGRNVVRIGGGQGPSGAKRTW